MPVTPNYPGVYIEEVPSGVRTIMEVPTDMAAFVGTATRGPVDAPILINSFADYEHQFGALSADSLMGYSVFQFYQNDGRMAGHIEALREEDDGLVWRQDKSLRHLEESSENLRKGRQG